MDQDENRSSGGTGNTPPLPRRSEGEGETESQDGDGRIISHNLDNSAEEQTDTATATASTTTTESPGGDEETSATSDSSEEEAAARGGGDEKSGTQVDATTMTPGSGDEAEQQPVVEDEKGEEQDEEEVETQAVVAETPTLEEDDAAEVSQQPVMANGKDDEEEEARRRTRAGQTAATPTTELEDEDEEEQADYAEAELEGEGVGDAGDDDIATPSCVTPAASANSSHSVEDDEVQLRPLVEAWVFGLNCNVPIHSLSRGDTEQPDLVYASSHIVVIYDQYANKQKLLTIHRNDISCLFVSRCHNWIVSADYGQHDSVLNIWDSSNRDLVRTYFNPHDRGAISAVLSDDAEVLVSLGGDKPQTMCVYDWSDVDQEEALATVELPETTDTQRRALFYPKATDAFITWSPASVIFFHVDRKTPKVASRSRAVSDMVFNRAVGSITGCQFDSEGSQLLSSTTEGNVIVWHPLDDADKTAHPLMRLEPRKLVHLSDFSVNCIAYVNRMLVAGTEDGKVSFFGDDMKLRYWYDQLKEGPIAALSFAPDSPFAHGQAYPADASKMARRFVIPEFFVSTYSNTVARCLPLGRGKFEVMLREHPGAVNCVAAHPFLSRIFTGSHAGYLKMVDYKRRVSLLDKRFPDNRKLETLAIDPSAEFLAVGFTDGGVQVLTALDLKEQSELFHMSKGCIRHMSFSHNGQYLATADADRCVVLYHRPTVEPEDDEQTSDDGQTDEDSPKTGALGAAAVNQGWCYLGKHRSHYKEIQGILFGVNQDTLEPRLFSLGADQKLIEYDLANSVEDDLRILTSDRIEQHATPLCFQWYPRLTKELFMLTGNNEFKLKLYNPSTKMTRYTFQAMACLSPMDKVVILPLTEHESVSADGVLERGYMVYAAADVIGMAQCPVDGNPYKYSRSIGHADGVKCMISSHDGQYVFTCGGQDRTVIMHAVNRQVMDASVELGGEGITPFYSCLPEGRRESEWFDKLMDYFYLLQLKEQGQDCQGERQVGQSIPAVQVPTILRSMGFYPTEYQISNMLNEIKFSTYSATGTYKETVDLEDVIRIFVNHRPLRGSTVNNITESFRLISESLGQKTDTEINTTDLLRTLQEMGEHLTESELAEHMCHLFCEPSDYLKLPADHQPGDALHTSTEPDGDALDVAEIAKRIPGTMDAGAFMSHFLDMMAK